MTLAFIKAVKTMRMSGRPSPFTSHSSSGDKTPPGTVTANHHTVVKKPPSPFSTLGEEAWPRKETRGQPSLTESAREPPMPGISHHGKIFHCMERQKCSIWVREKKGKNEELTEKDFCFPLHFLTWCGSHVSYERHRFWKPGAESKEGETYLDLAEIISQITVTLMQKSEQEILSKCYQWPA